MPAIITDNLKITNCTNFINDVSTGNYYTFIGFSNYNQYISDWNSNTPDPVDSIDYLNSYKDSILGVKKITSSDVIRVIPKIIWKSGLKYDMYRHDYSRYNPTRITNSTRLYDSRYYVMNRDYRVYICINNGSAPSNLNEGVISTSEPLHTSDSPLELSDGYVWKYLYTISPSDVLKFDSTNYISVPNNWQFSTDSEISRIRDASIDGKIETILIENSTQYQLSAPGIINNVPILGDGIGGLASVEFDENLKPIKVTVTEGGAGYTYATLDLDSIATPSGEKSIFNVIIPPKGGHGKNIYAELGTYRVLVYSRIENSITDPDFIEGNQFARVGIIKDLTYFNSNTLFEKSTGSGVYAIAIDSVVNEPEDSDIYQASTGSKGSLVSIIPVGVSSSIIKYTIPREKYSDTYTEGNITKTTDPYLLNNNFSGLTTATSYNFQFFGSGPLTIGSNSYNILNFTGSQIGDVFLGQDFNLGFANPDINTKSGEIVYVDNRVSVTRQSQQREDIKIIIEF
jgi:hypothetical protein